MAINEPGATPISYYLIFLNRFSRHCFVCIALLSFWHFWHFWHLTFDIWHFWYFLTFGIWHFWHFLDIWHLTFLTFFDIWHLIFFTFLTFDIWYFLYFWHSESICCQLRMLRQFLLTTKNAKAFVWQLRAPRQFWGFWDFGLRNQAVEPQGTRGGRFLEEPGPDDARTKPPVLWKIVRTPLGKPNWRITRALTQS